MNPSPKQNPPAPIILDHGDSQIVRYAKGWFVKTDTMADLRKIIGVRNMVSDTSEITDHDIVQVLVAIVHACGQTPRVRLDHLLPMIVFGTVYGGKRWPGEPSTPFDRCVKELLIIIRSTLILNQTTKEPVLTLADADPSILLLYRKSVAKVSA